LSVASNHRRPGEWGIAGLIAKGASRSGGAKSPIQVRAQVLRDVPTRCSTMPAFFLPDEDPATAAGDRSDGPPPQQADVERAVAAAEEAGLQDYRIEIAPDGTIAIVVGRSTST
jgi:hypothetical protein